MRTVVAAATILVLVLVSGCSDDSDQRQRRQQEVLLDEATSQVNMPGIKNFRERKLLKEILELRDQEGLATYTYIENQLPTIVRGRTALAGKLTYLGETIGYGIPYATQFTSPAKITWRRGSESHVLPQADPNGLFAPQAAEGTWVLMKDPGGDKTLPVYIEPRIVVSPFALPLD